MITRPRTLRAALPQVWIRAVSLRKKPSLSASNIATRDTSGMSSPSLRRLMPTRTSNIPSRKSLMIWTRSKVSMSEWRYLAFTPISERYLERSSESFLVRVVTKIRLPFSVSIRISSRQSSTWFVAGLISMSGSKSPVGLMICSTTSPCASCSSQGPGVADT